MSGERTIRLDVWADVACPWCYIGHRRLRAALEGAGPVVVRPRAFQLQPSLPAEGVDTATFFARKFGGPQRVQAMFARVAAAGAPDGIRFDWARMRTTNTRLAHRVVALAHARGQSAAALEALFAAQFEEGVDLGDQEALLAHLGRRAVPLDAGELRRALADGEGEAPVDEDVRLARELGIEGVPFFLADGELGLSGAQPPETFGAFLAQARSEGRGGSA